MPDQLDPAATDELAAVLGQPPAAAEPWSWIPDHWLSGSGPDSLANVPPPPPDGSAMPPLPPPVDSALEGAPPPALGMAAPAGAPAPPAALAGAPPAATGAPTGIAALPDITIRTEQPGEFAPPDALSGAGGMPAAGELSGEPYAARQTPVQQYRQLAQNYAAHPEQLLDKLVSGQIDPATQHYLDDFARRDQAGFTELTTRLADAKVKQLAAEKHRIAEQDWRREQANLEIRNKAIADARAKAAQLDAEAQRLANTKEDPTGGLSTGQRIAGVLMGIIGGLYQGKTGSSENIGMRALNDVINRNIAAQRTNLAQQREVLGLKRSALAEDFARSGDQYETDEKIRLAALKHADDLLATHQQEFAADGTRGIQIAKMRADIAGQQAKQLDDYQTKHIDLGIKLQTAAREQQLAENTLWKSRQDVAQGWARERREADKDKADKRLWTPEQLRGMNPGVPVVPPISMTQGDFTKWVATQKEGEQYRTAARANDPNERARELAVSGVVDDQGKPVLYSDSNIKEVRNGKETGEEMVRLTDDLLRMIKQNGWSSDFVKSEEWRKARSNFGELLIKKKEQDKLGVLTGPDVELVTKEIGTSDPTEARSQQVIAALLHFRHNVVEGLNTKLRTQAMLPEGRSVQRWEPRLDIEPAPKSQELELVERLKMRPDIDRDEARAQAGHDWLAARPDLPRDPLGRITWTEEVRRGYSEAARQAEDERHEVSPQQRRDLAALVQRGTSDDPATRARVLELLDGVAKDGATKLVRALADQAASQVRAAASPRVSGESTYELPPLRFGASVLPTFPDAPPPEPTFDLPPLELNVPGPPLRFDRRVEPTLPEKP